MASKLIAMASTVRSFFLLNRPAAEQIIDQTCLCLVQSQGDASHQAGKFGHLLPALCKGIELLPGKWVSQKRTSLFLGAVIEIC